MEIFSHVSTGWSALSAVSLTQPVVPLGRIGRRTCSHTCSSSSVVRAMTSTRSSVLSPVLVVRRPTVFAMYLGSAFAGATFCSTYA